MTFAIDVGRTTLGEAIPNLTSRQTAIIDAVCLCVCVHKCVYSACVIKRERKREQVKKKKKDNHKLYFN